LAGTKTVGDIAFGNTTVAGVEPSNDDVHYDGWGGAVEDLVSGVRS
jgi:hypothetical protein